jgi:hypothetical protein
MNLKPPDHAAADAHRHRPTPAQRHSTDTGMSESKAEACGRLTHFLSLASGRRQAVRDDPQLAARHHALKAWQAARLSRTHADLLAHPRFADAAVFFLEDLYGSHDPSQRDLDVARVTPKLVKFLPVAALSTLADALELDALSERLDGELADRLGNVPAQPITVASYGKAYRACANQAERERQILLTRGIGDALDGLTRMKMLERSLKLMRGPARLAGLANLQAFLERGFGAFKGMGDATPFLNAVQQRETRVMRALFNAEPDPFAVNDAAVIR